MLEVGNGHMTDEEYRVHISLWSLLSAPLLAGNDLSKMTSETISILTNKEVIALDQDPLGKQADRVSAVGPFEIWAKQLSNGSKAVALFNRGEAPYPMTLSLKQVGISHPVKGRDLWQHKDLGNINDNFTVVVPRHGVFLLTLQ
jgi:alpha-galactosidase